MSQPENAATSSTKTKRNYRKGNPLSTSERQQALVERRKHTHKEIKVYVSSELKHRLQMMCEAEGISQAEMISRLIQKASINPNK
ncbi:replication protein [Enterobacter hormaechei]|nr:replication regulatory protein RepA [Enterobacter hormaechei]MDU7134589.1 replication regulatory protein RepA [Enterobacteriaceae bacterium]MDU7197356.1 replication regulatory protein RepA [Enterobacteriaceae bacterium]GJL36761.1 replication protein [Enterobacter hormaechei]